MNGVPILITGASGGIASHIIVHLMEKYPASQIIGLSRSPLQVPSSANIIHYRGDCTDQPTLSRCLQEHRPGVIFHTAGIATVGVKRPTSKQEFHRVNVEATRTLLDEARKIGTVRAFVFTSSCSVAMKAPGGRKVIEGGDETWPTVDEEDRAKPYETSKSLADALVLAANDPSTFPTCSLRPSIVYGEYDQKILPLICDMSRRGHTFVQFGDGSARQSFTYGDNCALAHVLAAEALLSPSMAKRDLVAGEAFYVNDGESWSFWSFARATWQAADLPYCPPERAVVLTQAQAEWYVWASGWWAWITSGKAVMTREFLWYITSPRWFEIKKAKERLGYEPLVDTAEGIRRSVKRLVKQE